MAWPSSRKASHHLISSLLIWPTICVPSVSSHQCESVIQRPSAAWSPFRNGLNPLTQIWRGKDGSERPASESIRLLMRIMIPLGIERFVDRRTESFGQARAEDLAVSDRARSDGHVLVMHQRRQGGIEMAGLNPAGAEVVAIEVAGKIAVSPYELLAAPDGFFKREDTPGYGADCDARRSASASTGQ